MARDRGVEPRWLGFRDPLVAGPSPSGYIICPNVYIPFLGWIEKTRAGRPGASLGNSLQNVTEDVMKYARKTSERMYIIGLISLHFPPRSLQTLYMITPKPSPSVME